MRRSTIWHRKPPLAVGLDPSCPTLRSLVYYGAYNDGGGVPQNARNLPPVASPVATSVGWGWSDKGPAITFGGSSSLTLNSTGASPFDLPNSFTFVARCLFTTFGSNQTIIAKDNAGSNANYVWRANSGLGGKLNLFTGGTVATGNTVPSVNTWYTLAATYDQSNIILWINGAQDGSTGATASSDAAYQKVTIGQRPAGVDGMSGSIDYLAIWNRALSAAEIMRLHMQPYHVFAPLRSRRLFGRPANTSSFLFRTLANRAGRVI